MLKLRALTMLAALVAGPALAQTQVAVQSPTVQQITGAPCGYSLAYSTVTGFSADGNYVQSLTKGYVYCRGNGGYFYWCDQLQFDLSGNFVGFTVLGPNQWKCPTADATKVYTNAGGYTANSKAVHFPYSTVYQPELMAP
jgi:hypothetical protein